MMRVNAWIAAVGSCVLVWHECAENPAVFCYRMGVDAFRNVRSRALMLVPVMNSAARKNSRCLNRSGICSTASTMLKD